MSVSVPSAVTNCTTGTKICATGATTAKRAKMSDYVFEFGVSTQYHGSDVVDEIDLVDDLGFDEDELEGKSDEEIKVLLDQDLQDFVWENVDSWVKRV